MACAGSLHLGKVYWSRSDLPDKSGKFEGYLYTTSQPGAVYRFHIRPISYALARWAGCQYLFGLRYALSV
jgi:hypothetical protein